MSLSSGRPWACANAMASAHASMMPAHMIWLVALAAWPHAGRAEEGDGACRAPGGSAGHARTPAALPPAMMASVPSRAPSMPPLTGQSRNSTPLGSSSCAAWRAVSAPTVEQSMTRLACAQRRRQAAGDFQHVRVRGHARDHRVAGGGELGQRGGRGYFEFGGERAGLCRRCGSRPRPAGRRGADCAPCACPWHRVPRSLRACLSGPLARPWRPRAHYRAFAATHGNRPQRRHGRGGEQRLTAR